MIDWYKPRKPRWRFLLLDRHDRSLGRLQGVKEGGSIEVAALSRLGGSGSLIIDERGQDIDWLSHRVQVIYDPGITGVDPWPLATMMFTSPRQRRGLTYTSYEVTLLSKMAVIDESTVGQGFSYAEGTPIIAAVVALIQSTGETRIAITPSDVVLANPISWEIGTSKLTVINDLLAAANYWSLWCDGSGMFRVEPYRQPLERPVSHEFIAGRGAIHRAVWERVQDLSSVPNVFRVYREGDDETPGIEGVARNENPDSPFSIQVRGREITPPAERVEVASQEEADALALRRLTDATSAVAKLSVEHAIVPVEPHQLVRFAPRGLSSRLATVQSMKYQLSMSGHCSAEWREAS